MKGACGAGKPLAKLEQRSAVVMALMGLRKTPFFPRPATRADCPIRKLGITMVDPKDSERGTWLWTVPL